MHFLLEPTIDPVRRKLEGVFYTPPYIIRHMVKRTLGKFLKYRQPSQIETLKILDPACGSGLFLIEAFRFLMDWHLECYIKAKFIFKDEPDNPLILLPDGSRRLSVREKKRILSNYLYGVDIDEEAVRLTRQSLFQMVFDEAVPPTLTLPSKGGGDLDSSLMYGNNNIDTKEENLLKSIQCRNALIEPENNSPENRPDNLWGPFDIILGNPPYIKEYINKNAFNALRSSSYYQGKMDIWTLFACQAIDRLKPNGYFSFIAPNNWVTNQGASLFRAKILKEGEFEYYLDFGNTHVFKGALIQTMVYVFRKRMPQKNYTFPYIKLPQGIQHPSEIEAFLEIPPTTSDNISFEPEQYAQKSIAFLSSVVTELLTAIESPNQRSFIHLNANEIAQGVIMPQDVVQLVHREKLGDIEPGKGIFVLTQAELDTLNLSETEKKLLKPFYTSKEINRYTCQPKNRLWLIYTLSDMNQKIDAYPAIKGHLDRYQSVLTSDFKPYGLHRARKESLFLQEKILCLRKCQRPTFTWVPFEAYISQTYNMIQTHRINLQYLTVLLNSKLMAFWFRHRGKMQGRHYQMDREPLMRAPIIVPTPEEQAWVLDHFPPTLTLLPPKMSHFSGTPLPPCGGGEAEKSLDDFFFRLYGLSSSHIQLLHESMRDIQA